MFTVTINTRNQAFDVDPAVEIARILDRLSNKLIELGPGEAHGKVHDVNGNSVGVWRYSPDV
jgi:hypothetical protein